MTNTKESIFTQVKIQNYKSIKKLEIPLTHLNVFIGSNGCGKSNILEAIALLAAERDAKVKISDLQQIGVRITKPSLMNNSFLGEKSSNKITINLQGQHHQENLSLTPQTEDIFSDWVNNTPNTKDKINAIKNYISNQLKENKDITELPAMLKTIFENEPKMLRKDYLIYTLNTNALRGLSNESKIQPLGIYGEGLDLLLSTFSKEEWTMLNKYNYLIDWLEDIEIDYEDKLKYKEHKLGRSHSLLYFKDRFMRKNNNIFSAENSNEGVLHVLFYLALFISKKTPSFFAIDNIESSLNPRICRILIKILAELAVLNNKQALITTHNPAILDGLNLNDDNQALFVVKRTDEGYTKLEKIITKPQAQGEKLKLSEMWMRGYLGGLPNNF